MITPELADKIAQILIEECGAAASELRDLGFAGYLTRPNPQGFPLEWRFIGLLGFGGKFRTDSRGDHWQVDCYPEDMTPPRREMINRANRRLDRLQFEAERRLER